MPDDRYSLADPSVCFRSRAEEHCPATCAHLQGAWRRGHAEGVRVTTEQRAQDRIDTVALRLLGWAVLVALGWIWGRG